MTLPLVAIGVFLGGGLLALLAGRFPRASTASGAGGAIVGGVLGLYAALDALVFGTTASLRLPWDVPYGSFSIAIDPLSALFAVPVFGLTALAAFQGIPSLLAASDRRSVGPPWFFFNLMAAGLAMVVLARNGVLFLVAWEVMALASYFLVTIEHRRAEVREAGRTYLIATHLGTASLLAMFALMGRHAGSLDFDAIAGNVPAEAAGVLFLLAVVGFGTKAGFAPFHVWLPEAYPAAPSFVAAVMSGAMSKVGLYGLFRTLTLLPDASAWWAWTLIGLGIGSGLWGILHAMAQGDYKRLLAFSGVENVGIVAMGMGVGLLGVASKAPVLAVLGFAGALFHVLNHATFKGLLFLSAGVIEATAGTREIDLLGGLSRRMPAVSAATLIGSAAIMGLPPLNGFAGEFLIFSGAFRTEMVLGSPSSALALAVIGALALIGGLAAVTFTKSFGIVFLGSPRTERAATASRPHPMMAAPMFVLAAACVLVGLASDRVVGVILPAVAPLVGMDPRAIPAIVRESVEPLWSVNLASALLAWLVVTLAIVRGLLLAGRDVTASSTWGCGYQGATARMQYTGSSFVEPAIKFFAPFLKSRESLASTTGVFPGEGSFSAETRDVSKDALYRPAFAAVGRTLARLRWVQGGRVHVYVLYIGLTIVALLVWYLGVSAR